MHPTPTGPRSRTGPPNRTVAGDLGALARLCGLATVLGSALLALLRVGRRLPSPPLSPWAARSPDAWSAWVARLGPAGALMSVVRTVAILLAAYLMTLVVIEMIGQAAGLPRLLSLGHILSTPMARQLVGGAAGLGLAFSVTAVSLGPTAAASADPVMHALEPVDGGTVPDAPTMTTLEPEAPVMHAVDPPPVPTTGATSPTTGVAPTGASPQDAVAARWVIQSGDHLWGVARRTLAGTWHRPPTDAETARYLDRLVEANLEVLVVPGDADLVRPGQVFELPLVPTG